MSPVVADKISSVNWKIEALFFLPKKLILIQKHPTNMLRTSRNQFINLINLKNPNHKIKLHKISHPQLRSILVVVVVIIIIVVVLIIIKLKAS
jgi:Trk-type K+ transport system membrane component